jgi:hypothetical protein
MSLAGSRTKVFSALVPHAGFLSVGLSDLGKLGLRQPEKS